MVCAIVKLISISCDYMIQNDCCPSWLGASPFTHHQSSDHTQLHEITRNLFFFLALFIAKKEFAQTLSDISNHR